MVSREKSSRGSGSPRRPTRSGLRILLQVPSAACGTRPRELSNGWARKRMRDRIRTTEFEQHDCAKSTGRSVERCDLWVRKRMRDRIRAAEWNYRTEPRNLNCIIAPNRQAEESSGVICATESSKYFYARRIRGGSNPARPRRNAPSIVVACVTS